MENAASMQDTKESMFTSRGSRSSRKPADLNALLLAMRERHSSNPIDKVCAIAFPFQKRRAGNFHVTFPIYDPSTPVPIAWERLISSISSTKMEVDDLVKEVNDLVKDYDDLVVEVGDSVTEVDNLVMPLGFQRTTTIQLLCLFPHPSRHHWFPSWAQVQQYPDVSVRDNDPDPVAADMDYSLRIMSGRIYRGCSLELKQPPTSERKAAYNCSMGMDSECVELVATVPSIELNIDSRSTYVLVDISPDCSLWPSQEPCDRHRDLVEHVHPPIWRKSVIIICKEVDVQTTTRSPTILRYRLRRITTLELNCERPSSLYSPNLALGPPSSHHLPQFQYNGQLYINKLWLPFKPSLEHMRSVVCRAKGTAEDSHSVTPLCLLDVFCDPAAVAGLPIKNGRHEWDKCPVYEVYLV